MSDDLERPGELEALKRALAPQPMPATLRRAILTPAARRNRWIWPAAAAAAAIIVMQAVRIHDLEKQATPAAGPKAVEPSLADSRDVVIELTRRDVTGWESLQSGLPAAERDRIGKVFDEALASAGRSLKSNLLKDAPAEDLLASLSESFDRAGLKADLEKSRRGAAAAWGAQAASEVATAVGLDADQTRRVESALADAAGGRNDVLVLPDVVGAGNYAVLTGLVRRIEGVLRPEQIASLEKFVAASRADLRERALFLRLDF